MSTLYDATISEKEVFGDMMKTRKQNYGSGNMIGKQIYLLREEKRIKQKDFIAQLQANGLDINPTSYSKLEGQVRSATDKEVYHIAKALGVPMEALFPKEDVSI